jgi:hypothetical protein
VILDAFNNYKLNDIVDQATSCKDLPSASYKANPIALDGQAVDEGEIRKSAQRILDVAASVAIDKAKQNKTEEDLKAFNFAIGLGSIILNNKDVRSATVDQGIVRTTDEEKYKIGIWLSTNTYFKETNNSRYGFFMATQLGGGGNNSDLLSSFAVGLSWTASHRPATASLGNAPLVFQIGYGITRIQRYADGYGDGRALPSGANQPLTKKTTEAGPVLLVSYSLE